MKLNKQIANVSFRMYPVPGHWFQFILEHDDLQGDVYWMSTIIIFSQAFQIHVDGNTHGQYTLPKINFRLFKYKSK